MDMIKGLLKPLWVKILLIFLAVTIAVAATGYYFLHAKLNLINNPGNLTVIPPEDEFFEVDEDDETDETDTSDTNVDDVVETKPEDVVWAGDEDIMRDKDVLNILLIGQDRRPGEKRARSDSMMIATINKKNKTVKLTSLMRDMYVQIPGYSDNRINAAYIFGGMELLNATIEKNFLIHIDGNIEVDFNGFQQVVDKIGGVDINLNGKEAAHLSKQGFPDLTEGIVHMDGDLALAYARIRKVGNSDFERTERQRRVAAAAYQKIKGLRLDEIYKLIDVVFPLVTTDMSNNQILSLAFNVLMMDVGTLETNRIPVNGTFKDAKIRGMLVLVPDLAENRKALKNIIYGE